MEDGGRTMEPGTGRRDPRVARSRAAVLAAATGLVREEGMTGVSIEAVSARSGVAKTTIYRHWPSRAALVVDAFRALSEPCTPPDTGSVRDDLVRLLESLAAKLAGEGFACALGGLLEAAERDPELGRLHAAFMVEVRGPFADVLDRGVARGELPADLDRSLAAMLLPGPLFYRRMVAREPVTDPAEVAALVDAVLPVLRRTAVPAGA